MNFCQKLWINRVWRIRIKIILGFVGHSLRRNENDLISKYVRWAQEGRHGSRGRGKPHRLFRTYIELLIKSDNPPTVNEMRQVATSVPP
jgi:hypothetical protein